MLSLKFVFRQSKNFTSDDEIQMPPTVPFNHYLNGLKGAGFLAQPPFENQQNKTSSLILLSHANVCKAVFFRLRLL